MRHVLENQHRDFFTKEGYIAFDNLFSPEALDSAEAALSGNGRDLWRTSEPIKTLVMQKSCAEIAAELCQTPSIRLAYDQGICSTQPSPLMVKTPFSLEDISCIQPILCGMLIRLTEGPTRDKTTPFCPCPMERGEALFFSGKMLIVLDPLFTLPKQKFLLVAYSGKRPQYVAKEKDPFYHSLKSFGYVFGDHLTPSTHPVLFSKH